MLSEKLGVPIGFINVGVGSSSIQEWQSGKPHFQRLVKAIKASQPYGVRAILWHQGESDRNMNSDEYLIRLAEIIDESQTESISGHPIPWLVARASYSNGTISDPLREAQQKILDKNMVFSGPDTDVLTSEYREISDNVHFNELGTRKVAKLWCQKINHAFFDN